MDEDKWMFNLWIATEFVETKNGFIRRWKSDDWDALEDTNLYTLEQITNEYKELNKGN